MHRPPGTAFAAMPNASGRSHRPRRPEPDATFGLSRRLLPDPRPRTRRRVHLHAMNPYEDQRDRLRLTQLSHGAG